MHGADEVIVQTPVQDRDLLLRMSQYCDSLESRLRQGQGWFIFNADNGRSGRVARFIEQRLEDREPPVTAFVMPWRDFSLNAYVMEIGLPELEPVAKSGKGSERSRQEYDFAQRVTAEVWSKLQESDLLIVAGIQPKHPHEMIWLDRAVDERYARRRATILMTPSRPQDLEAEIESIDVGKALWDRVFTRMYETSLVAL